MPPLATRIVDLRYALEVILPREHFTVYYIIPIEQAWGTRIENSNAYWYVSSEVTDPTQAPVVPEASAASIHPDTTTLLTGPKADEETACLIGQALGVHA